MTLARIVGTSFGSGILQAKNKYVESRDGKLQILRTFRAFEDGWIAGCPARGTAHPDFADATLVERTADPSSIPMLVDVTLTYETPPSNDDPATSQPLPPDEYSETANSVEAPIEAHPGFYNTYRGNPPFGTVENGALWNAEGKFIGWTKESPYAGILTYKVASVSETWTKYFWDKPDSVSTLIGYTDEIEPNWLIISGGIQRRYPYWTRSITRIWSETAWPAVIYPQPV
jgi:hypothetical protein